MATVFSPYHVYSPTLQGDTDAFNMRLRDINAEMQSILERTNPHRSDIDRMYAAASYAAPWPAAPAPAAAAVAPAPAPAMHSPPAPFELTEEAKQWMSAHIKSQLEAQTTHIVALIAEQHVSQSLHRITSKSDTLSHELEMVKVTVGSLADQWRGKQDALDAAMARVETTTRSSLQQYQSDAEISARRWLDDMGALRDSVGDTGRKAQLLEQRTARRLDELVHSQQEAVRASLAEMERRVAEWRAEMAGLVRDQALATQAQRDTAEGHVARLRGTVAGVADASAQHAADLTTLMEGAVEQRSEVRSCRRDVNRLEMLIQAAAGGGGSSSMSLPASAAAFAEGLQRNADNSTAPLLMAQEISKAREHIGFLGGRIEGLERHMHRLDAALLAVSAGTGAGVGTVAAVAHHPSNGVQRSQGHNHFIANASYNTAPLQQQQQHHHHHSSERDHGSSLWPGEQAPHASTRRPSRSGAGGGGGASSFSASHISMTQVLHSQQQQQQQRPGHGHYPGAASEQPPPQHPSTQQSQWQAGLTGSTPAAQDRPMSVMMGASAGSSFMHGPPSATTPVQLQPQPQQPGMVRPSSGFFAAAVAAGEEPAALRGGQDQFLSEPMREISRGSPPPQRRASPTIIEVDEEQVDVSALQVGSFSGASANNSGSRFVAHASDQAYGGGADADSYVSRTESRSGSQVDRSRSDSGVALDHSGQYQPVHTSDSESNRENESLSRMPID